jgi:hypothetical protein
MIDSESPNARLTLTQRLASNSFCEEVEGRHEASARFAT